MSKSGAKSFWKLGECVKYDSGGIVSLLDTKMLFVGGLYLELLPLERSARV